MLTGPTVDLTGQATPAIADKQLDKGSGVTAAPEATQAEAKPPVTEEALSPKFAALARKERALRAEKRALEAKQGELKALEAELQSAKAWKQRLTQDPFGVLNEAGLTYDQLTQLAMNQPKPEELELQRIKQELEAVKAAQSSSETKQVEQALTQIRREVDQLVNRDETYELIKAYGAQDHVVQVIKEVFDEHGEFLSVEEAAQEIEEVLLNDYLEKAKLKKIQAKLTPPKAETPVEAEPATKQVPSTQKPLMNTLSHRIESGPAKPLTAKERRERAILAFQGKLA